MNEGFTRPPLTIEMSTGRKIKMTYGLEMDLRRLLPDPVTAMQMVLNDPFTQDYVIRRCLTPINRMLTQDELTEDEVELDSDDTEKLILWAVEHVLYFFAKRAAAMVQLGSKFQMDLPNRSTNGSPNSPTTTPSAGPSE